MTDDYPTRRGLLKSLGGVAALAALAGCPDMDSRETEEPPTTPDETATESPTPETTRAEEEPDPSRGDVIDVVEAGASPNGDEPTVPVLDSLPVDGTTILFPEGEYLLTQPWRVKEFEDLSVIGDNATFRVEEGYNNYLFILGSPDGATGLTVENLEFDITAPETGARPLHGMVKDGLEVSDITVTGTQDVDQDSLRFDVTAPDGTGVVERLSLTDGGDADYLITGCYVGEAHTGTLRFVDCHIAGFPDNGLYASSATGKVIVEGGRYENNDISNVRVSGPAEVRGVHVRCDTAPDGFANMRGIRLREGRNVLVEDCTVEIEQVTGSDGAITMSSWLDEATIRNTEITVDADNIPAVVAKSPNEAIAGNGEYQVRIENVTVSGSAEGTAAVRLLDREECLVDNVCIRQNGARRDGIQCKRVSNSTLSDSSIAVTGRPVVLEDATVDQVRLQTEQLGGERSSSNSSCR